MGFGKFIKKIVNDVADANDLRKERKRRGELREYERSENIASGKFCKGCAKTGEFNHQCGECLKMPFCDNCSISNQRWGTRCMHCARKYMCVAEGCGRLSDDDCMICQRQICQGHWQALFVKNGQFFACPYDNGNICKSCAEGGKVGTFRKHYTCQKCGNDLQIKTVR